MLKSQQHASNQLYQRWSILPQSIPLQNIWVTSILPTQTPWPPARRTTQELLPEEVSQCLREKAAAFVQAPLCETYIPRAVLKLYFRK